MTERAAYVEDHPMLYEMEDDEFKKFTNIKDDIAALWGKVSSLSDPNNPLVETKKTTDDLPEGDVNLYYTDARVANYLATHPIPVTIPAGTPLRGVFTDAAGTITTPDLLQTDAGASYVLTTVPLYFTQTDGNEQIDSQADGYVDYTVTTAHRFRMATADTDVRIELVGTSNSGLIEWMEDEDYVRYSDDIFMNSYERIYFNNTNAFITFRPANGTSGLEIRDDSVIYMNINGTDELTLTSTTATFGTNIVIPDAAYIGSASDTDALQIEADGDIVLTQSLYMANLKSLFFDNGSGTDEQIIYVDGTTIYLGAFLDACDDVHVYSGAGESVFLEDQNSTFAEFNDTGFKFYNNMLSGSANGYALGGASNEWSDLYLGDGAVIYGQNDQSNTITSSAGGWTFNIFPITPSAAPDADYEVANKKYVDDNDNSYGADNQIPYTNGTTDDFDYSANLVFDGSTLGVGSSTAPATLTVYNATVPILALQNSTSGQASENVGFTLGTSGNDAYFNNRQTGTSYFFNAGSAYMTAATAANNLTYAGGALTFTMTGKHTYNGSEFVFNEASADADFRVESNNHTHQIFVDAGNDRLGINESAPEYLFHCSDTISAAGGSPRLGFFDLTSDPNGAANTYNYALEGRLTTGSTGAKPAYYQIVGLVGQIVHSGTKAVDLAVGLDGVITLQSGSGTIAEYDALAGFVVANGGTATKGIAVAGNTDCYANTTITTAFGLSFRYSATNGDTLTCTNAYGVAWDNAVGAGTLNFTNFYGLYFPDMSSVGSGISEAIHTEGGDWVNLHDTSGVVLGAGRDIRINFDGDDLIVNSLNITANDEVHFTNFTKYTFDNDITTTEDIVIGDGKFIGSTSDPDAMSIASTGYIGVNNPAAGRRLEVSDSSTSTTFEVSTWSTTDGDKSNLVLSKSASNTINTEAATGANDIFGEILFRGVNTSNSGDTAVSIKGSADAAPDADAVPGKLLFQTSNLVGLQDVLLMDDDQLSTFYGNIVIPDAGTIGSASDTDAIAIAAGGDVTLTQDLVMAADKEIRFGDVDIINRNAAGVHSVDVVLDGCGSIWQFEDSSNNGLVRIKDSDGATEMVQITNPLTNNGAIVLTLDQGDVDQPFLKFIGDAAAATLTNDLVDAGDVGTFTVNGYLKIEIQDDGSQISNGDYYVAFGTLTPPA